MNELYEKSLHKLELDRVLELLAGQAVSEAAKVLCRQQVPRNDLEEIEQLQNETAAACACMIRKGSPSLQQIQDVGPSLDRADRGGSLSMGELLKIARLLRSARVV